MKPIRVIISGGGTGGHIFPAIAIANALRAIQPDAEILFVGAQGKMEMEKVPQAGYRIEGLPILGIQRRLTLKNLLVPFRIIQSLLKARSIIRDFQPDVAVGVGGYASGPLLRAAASMNIPTLIQEQNSYPGITNKLLSGNARTICVAYDGLGQWFPEDKIKLTGNPVRAEMGNLEVKKEKALAHFGLNKDRPVILIIGGSLGARTINDSVAVSYEKWIAEGFQLIWQTGKSYENQALRSSEGKPACVVRAFISEMDLAYAAADIIVSRAGAMSISELCLVGKPCILIPSPNVAEDHQTKNAMSLVKKNAAWLLRDSEAREKLGALASQLIQSPQDRKSLADSIRSLGRPEAAQSIALEVLRLTNSGI
jgi:UDP-N-acetylglucosamine--N-acetylmuramyl-(pentapeptide) pyrophosphoryl-undecaprenol N-acetylglucosamine transferase